ncbi:MAG: HDIG domain-containing metalloprotein [Bacteroidota bacterium]
MPEELSSVSFLQRLRSFVPSRTAAVRAALTAALVAGVAWMFPRGDALELDYKVGGIWARKDLIAPFSFPVYREEAEYLADLESATSRTPPVFQRTDSAASAVSVRRRLEALRRAVKMREEWDRILAEGLPFSSADSMALEAADRESGIRFSEGEWNLLGSLSAGIRQGSLDSLIQAVQGAAGRAGYLDRPKDSLTAPQAALRRGTFEELVPPVRLLDGKDLRALLRKGAEQAFGGSREAAALTEHAGMAVLAPTLLFDSAATRQSVLAARDRVPRTTGVVQENERIVGKHERITHEIRLKLESLLRARADRGSASAGAAQIAGIVLHVAVVILLFGIYLFLFRRQIFGNNRRLALIALLIFMQAAIAALTRELNVAFPIEYLILVPAASMLLTVVFDSRVGFYGTVIIAFLVAGIRGNDYSIALASLAAGALAVYTVRDMKNRTQIYRSLGFIFLGYALAILALALERFESLETVLQQMLFALINALVSPVLTYGLLIFVERVFRVTTDLSLMELARFHHPLLRQLAEKAPGTYHHSTVMATLAETAAEAIGANSVLARAGALFHDIGKIAKPTYYVENQKGSRSRHDKLAPRMSSLIIASHVKEGMALAAEHRLPEEVIDFIPMHHGTTRMEYFYAKALRLAETSSDETKLDEIREQDYRYRGPKPQTRETGILMLADAVEAAARTVEDPSPGRLEGMIDDLIKKRFVDGELDECPLTLKDLTRIRAAFLGVLVGIHHSRVKYPGEETPPPPVRERKPRRRAAQESPGPAGGEQS